jgi:fibro-slime domain-containing protein
VSSCVFVGADKKPSWVFIGDRLVIDLGGVHTQQNASVSLDSLPFLTKGSNYGFDLFYNERHTVASDLRLFTSIPLYCSYIDWCGVCQGSGQSCCKCNDNNTCTQVGMRSNDTYIFQDSCNITTGECIFTNKTCTPPDSCTISSCDRQTAACINTTKDCNDYRQERVYVPADSLR